MTKFSLLVCGIAALLWLLPTPGEKAMASLAMLMVLWLLSRASRPTREAMLAALCGGIIGVATEQGPLMVMVRALGIVLMGLSAGPWGAAALAAGGAGFFLTGRLEPAAVCATMAVMGRRSLALRAGILASAAGLSVLAGFSSFLLAAHGQPQLSHGWAAVLNRRNPEVMLRVARETMASRCQPGALDAMRMLADIERRTGVTAASWALRIVAAHLAQGDARALLAEAALRRPAALDSLASWNGMAAPWMQLASSFHRGTPPLHALRVPMEDLARDSLAAEYGARLLLDMGLEAEACTLASLPAWRSTGWSRYVVWKARHPWEAPTEVMAVGRHAQTLPAGAWLLTKGAPARSVWPVYRLEDEASWEETPAWSEGWNLVPRAMRSQCRVTLMNDLHAPGEDRNAWIAPAEGMEEGWYVDPPKDFSGFCRRLAARLARWGEGTVGDGAKAAEVMETWERIPVSARAGAVDWDGGVMLPAEGFVRWEVPVAGAAMLVVRGQQAVCRWPIMELSWGGAIRRTVVDASAWTCVSLQLSSAGVLSSRFVNDFWDPATGQDRNLWIAGLFIHPSQARDHAR